MVRSSAPLHLLPLDARFWVESVPYRETDMRKSRLTEEQIIRVLKEHAAGLSAGELCRKYGISDAPFAGRTRRKLSGPGRCS
jgi:hypothetical protein